MHDVVSSIEGWAYFINVLLGCATPAPTVAPATTPLAAPVGSVSSIFTCILGDKLVFTKLHNLLKVFSISGSKGSKFEVLLLVINSFTGTHFACGSSLEQPYVSTTAFPVSTNRSKIRIVVSSASFGAFILLSLGALFVSRYNQVHKLRRDVFVDVADLKPGEKGLDWPMRKRIAFGAAHGLEYLHEHCNSKIIHRDLMAANILLDYNFEAVFGDFGLAKLVDTRLTHVTTQRAIDFARLEEDEDVLLLDHSSPEDRPTMAEVVKMLEGVGLAERWAEWEELEQVRNGEFLLFSHQLTWGEDSSVYSCPEPDNPTQSILS
ncbi:hypothetical protein CRYUN_Cryun15aG0063800 [Craigia yunnanensis]